MVKLVAMIMGDAGRMNCWKTTSAQYPTAHFMAITNLLWTIISAKSSPIKASSSQKVWGRKAITLAPISSHNPARGSNMRCSVSISHQAGFLKVLAPFPSHTRPAFSKCLRNMARAISPPITAPTTGARNSTTSMTLEERAARVFT